MTHGLHISRAGLGHWRDLTSTARLCMTLGLLSLASLFWSPTAHAFGDCNDSHYVARFGLTVTTEARCEPVSTEASIIRTEHGPSRIRIVRLVRSARPADEETILAAQHAVDDVIHAALRLGRFSMDEATILVDNNDVRGSAEIFGSHAVRTQLGRDENECYITVGKHHTVGSTQDTGGSAEEVAPLIASALFRCIEGSTLRPAQIDTTERGYARWWYEGSADWFATLAIDSEEFRHARMDDFDHDSPNIPLHHMREEASIFFDWLTYTRGDLAIIPMLRHMADSGEESAQILAMNQAVTPTEWLNFAEAYLDKKIFDGQDRKIESEPEEGEEWEWEGTTRIPLVLEPFQLIRHRMKFSCAPWTVFEIPDTPEARRVPGLLSPPRTTSSLAYSMAIHTVDSNSLPWTSGVVHPAHGPEYWFAGMYTGLSPIKVVVVGNAGPECEEDKEPPEKIEGSSKPKACAGYRKIDTCMVGKWKLSGGGPIKWMQEVTHGHMHAHVEYTDKPTIDLKEDGTSTGHMSGEIDSFIQHSHSVFTAHGTNTTSGSANWSVHNGTAYFCETSSTGPQLQNFHAETRLDNGTVIKHKPRLPLPKVRVVHMRYTCSGDTLHMVLNIGAFGMGEHKPGMAGGLPPMPFTYTRVNTASEDDTHEHE